MSDADWDICDAWLMLAVAGAGGDLRQLIAAAEVRNHAIPLHHELEQSVGRLIASGLATADGTAAALTPAGLALAGRARGGLFTQADHLLTLLARQPLTGGHWMLSPDAYQRACDSCASPDPASDQSS